MNILIRNADIITFDEQGRVLRQMDLAVADDAVVSAGETSNKKIGG